MEAIIDGAVGLAWGSAGIDRQPVDLAECAREAWEHVETADATLERAAVPTLSADRELLMQLLENLFANAIRHGGDDVTVTVEPTDEGFAVTDSGPGIDPDDGASVFEAGVSLGSEAGTGLGLAIVEKVATAHGWTVTTAEDPRGARFEIALARDSTTAPHL
jgi:signal transduction histidine kinase